MESPQWDTNLPWPDRNAPREHPVTTAPTRPAIASAPRPDAPGCRLTFPEPCRHPAPCGVPCELKLGPERHAVVGLGPLARFALLAVPGSRGPSPEQADELFRQIRCIVDRQTPALEPTTMMVFLRDADDEAVCEERLRAHFGSALPVTTFVVQPPCCGAALGVELWAMGGPGVRIERPAPQVLTAEAAGIRWVYCGGIRGEARGDNAYRESIDAFHHMEQGLAQAGVDFDQVVRTWIYVNGITDTSGGLQRYQELNRARADFYRHQRFARKFHVAGNPAAVYPASTGIGTGGSAIGMACVALDTQRSDVLVVPLENPGQTPAYDYQAFYSPQAPKFSRAMAIVQGAFASYLVSGTASIVDSRSVHPGDPVRQTEQTLDNIARLLAPANVARWGLPGGGASLAEVAKLRVYVKHRRDYEVCREVVERRLPRVPAIYLQADVCRPDLLVEIEAVAFAPYHRDEVVSGSSHTIRNPTSKTR